MRLVTIVRDVLRIIAARYRQGGDEFRINRRTHKVRIDFKGSQCVTPLGLVGKPYCL